MIVEVPYDNGKVEVEIDKARVGGIIEANNVPIADESETVRNAIENPVNSKKLSEFLADARDVLFIVNDATRATPTARVLEILYEMIKSLNVKFIVATGAHRVPTEEECYQIFGRFYEEFKSRIYFHDARADKDMVYIGKSRNGTEMSVNRIGVEAHKIVIIGSVEPHYHAGYTGGRKAFLPGIASYKSIEQNHSLALRPEAESLKLKGNPVHEDMIDAIGTIRDKEIFAIMTVLDRDHHLYAATAGNIDDSLTAATGKAKEVFAVAIKEKVDIVVAVARFPMDIDLYQSQKALENGKLALKEGGVIILVSKCRSGIGDDTFTRLLSSCSTPAEALEKISKGYVLGYHKAAKMAEIGLWAEIYGVTGLPDELISSVFITPFHSLQEAVDSALTKMKGKDARVLFFMDGGMTVPLLDKDL
jgi:nickel-dependent lactate racemase